jgi:hypothetical protein
MRVQILATEHPEGKITPTPGFEPGIPCGTSYMAIVKLPGLRNTRLCDVGKMEHFDNPERLVSLLARMNMSDCVATGTISSVYATSAKIGDF